MKDLLLHGRPQHDANIAVAYGDSDWATCVKTRRSFSGICIQLAGGTIAYKTKFQPTVALSSTEAEFMAACNVGRMCLFIRSILWDLDIPQEAATVAYEDNDGCTSMGNAQKPTPHTRHIDIRYFALCDWIKRDLIILERIDTSINCWTISQKHFPASSFIDMPITFSVMFPLRTRRYIDKQLPHTATSTRTLIRLFLNHSPLPPLLVLHGSLLHYMTTYETIRAY
jgi:hypothetical protein